MAQKPNGNSDAELDAIVFDAVRYNRYRGVTLDRMKGYVGTRHKGETTEETLAAVLSRLEIANQVVCVGKRWLLHPAAFREAKGDAWKPEFEFADTWILMCILSIHEAGPCTISEIIPVADGINHAIPSLDELHGALNRLLAAGLIATRKGAYVPTDRALSLRQKVQASCPSFLWDQMEGLANILKCPCCGIKLKRVTWRINVTEGDVAAAYEQYSSAAADRRKETKAPSKPMDRRTRG